MKREDLIQKWLDHNLTSDELEAFKQLEDYDDLVKLSNGMQHFKAPEYNTSEALSNVMQHINTSKQTLQKKWLSIAMSIAAVFVLSFGIYFFTINQDTLVNTQLAEKTTIELPDASSVALNSLSEITFNSYKWNKNRTVDLKGEAFFKVEKGSSFNVNTVYGAVTVYGTQFNVKQRENYFEVICYEGLVGVTYKGNETKLHAGESFLLLNGKLIEKEKELKKQPSWLNNESYFKSMPYKEVIAEFERQYDVNFHVINLDSSQLFTGSFTHNNIENALKSITLPLHLTYKKTDNTITLKRE
ncbi:FecR family protein [Gaetbulibacter jejuensis]|uniref:FecR family protein n=1 Tax=Gaetbulibacter jejuensis TaxID=584607 RepID=UPI00300B6A0D